MGNSPAKELKPAAVAVISKKIPTSWDPRKVPPENLEVFTCGAGCFWGIELAFARIPGVLSTEVGYTNGNEDIMKRPPDYESVCTGKTGYVEAVRVEFDSSVVTYSDMLEVFWCIHDPTQANGQGGDIGTQYRSGIYYSSDRQKRTAQESRVRMQGKLDRDIATEISLASRWYPAEDYHQQYLAKGGQCSLKGDLSPIRCYG